MVLKIGTVKEPEKRLVTSFLVGPVVKLMKSLII